MSILSVGVLGGTGRVGRRVCALVHSRPTEMELTAVFATETSRHLNKPIELVEPTLQPYEKKSAGRPWEPRYVQSIRSWMEETPSNDRLKIDVIIDFSTPEATVQLCQAALVLNCAIVIGTTGFSLEQLSVIEQTSKRIPVLLAPNFSVMFNVLVGLVAKVAAALPDADAEIIETHHRNKRDAPSGTALSLADAICEPLGRSRQDLKHGRSGLTGIRDQREIGMHAVRLGGVVGDHTVCFGSELERLELTHRAQSRDSFADGAIRAAQWLVKNRSRQPLRVFSMQDVVAEAA